MGAGGCAHAVWVPCFDREAPSYLQAADWGRAARKACTCRAPLLTLEALPSPTPSRPQADGSVVIPEVLRPFMMGIDVIRPKKKVEA